MDGWMDEIFGWSLFDIGMSNGLRRRTSMCVELALTSMTSVAQYGEMDRGGGEMR